MWCDNCLLVMPLRAGAMVWNLVIMAYSIAGSVLLFLYGDYFFFYTAYYEAQIYGAIGMAVAAVAFINLLALSNRSYIWTRVCKFLWPFIIIISAIRAIIMIVELERNKDEIQWECNNGGTMWTTSTDTAADSTSTLPSGFCSAGYSSLNAAYIISLLVDLVFQIYAFFMCWRFSKRLEHYREMQGPYGGGYYKA